LSKIKIQQIEKDRGEWESLTPEARREKEAGLQMFGQLARFHNIMSNETIGTLSFLTSGKNIRHAIPQNVEIKVSFTEGSAQLKIKSVESGTGCSSVCRVLASPA
jgi:hypothetical protein